MIELHESRISRRGKAAKGTVVVHTFGKPVVNADGVAKGWDYSDLANVPVSDAIDAIRLQKQNPVIAMFMGSDIVNKSEAIRTQNIIAILTARILAESLADDKETATNVAKSFVAVRSNMLKGGVEESDVYTYDELLEMRRAKLIKGGKQLPRLVDNRNVKSLDDEVSEASDDSEDEDSEEDSE